VVLQKRTNFFRGGKKEGSGSTRSNHKQNEYRGKGVVHLYKGKGVPKGRMKKLFTYTRKHDGRGHEDDPEAEGGDPIQTGTVSGRTARGKTFLGMRDRGKNMFV